MSEDTKELPSTPPLGHVTVYDKEGKPHVMNTLNAHDMVQHCGWARTIAQPKVADAAPQVLVVTSKKVKEPIAPENAETVDITKFTPEELRAFAKEHFELDFPAGTSADEIINAILEERGD